MCDDNTGDLDGKKAAVTSKLQQRNEERINALQQKRVEKETTAVAHETTQYFLQKFSQFKEEIEQGLITIDAEEVNARLPKLEQLKSRLDEMQKYLTDCVSFLPLYNLQSAQAMVAQLKTNLEAKGSVLVPKTKFAFKGNKKKVAAETVDGPALTKPPVSGNKSTSSKPQNTEVIDCGFQDRTGEELRLTEADMKTNTVRLSGLVNCTVTLTGIAHTVVVDNLKGCRIFCGPVSGSVFVDSCTDCVMAFVCQQLRVHTTTKTTFYLHVTSKAIVEDCSGIYTAPYNVQYDRLEGQFADAHIDKSRNNWDKIDDFNWLASDKPSPNWSILESAKREPVVTIQ